MEKRRSALVDVLNQNQCVPWFVRNNASKNVNLYVRHHHHQNAVAIWNANAKLDTQDTLIIQDCFLFSRYIFRVCLDKIIVK